ncbi:MAG: hypothetical protein Q9173_003474 [Seirophora scorigena]
MRLKLPTLLVVASAAVSCLAASPFDGSEVAARESSAAAEDAIRILSARGHGPPLVGADAVGLAEICGCAPGKVGYFLHGHCACSGDPLEPPYESPDTVPDVEGSAVAEAETAPIVNNNHTLDTRKPKGICLKNCNRYWRAERQRDGSCKCVEQNTDWHRKKRAPSFTPEQGLALVNDDPLFMWYYATNPTQGELKCVVYKECTTKEEPNPSAPIRGTVNTEGHCVCAPKKAGRDLASKQVGSSERDLQYAGQNMERLDARVPQAPPDCRKKACGDGYTGVKSDSLTERGGSILVFDHAPAQNVPHEGKSYSQITAYCTAHRPCPRGMHAEQHMVGNTCWCLPNAHRKRRDLDECPNFSCPNGRIPKLNGSVCYCGMDGDFPYSQGPASRLDAQVRDSLRKRGRYSKVTDKCNKRLGKKWCLPGSHPEERTTSTGRPLNSCWCAGDGRKRRDLDECPNFSCPSGWIPKLNGSVCYCGMDGDFPYPQGPASWGPHGALPSGNDEASSS